MWNIKGKYKGEIERENVKETIKGNYKWYM